jgi:hypothetical protein
MVPQVQIQYFLQLHQQVVVMADIIQAVVVQEIQAAQAAVVQVVD